MTKVARTNSEFTSPDKQRVIWPIAMLAFDCRPRPFRDAWVQKRPKNGPYQTSADETDAEFLPSGVSFTPGSRQVARGGAHGALWSAVS